MVNTAVLTSSDISTAGGLLVQNTIGSRIPLARSADTPNGLFSAPYGFKWDFTKYPIGWKRQIGVGGAAVYEAEFTPYNFIDSRVWNGLKLHVDPVNGSDTNSGIGSFYGDFASAVKSIKQALILGNTSGAPYTVTLKASRGGQTIYKYTEGFQNYAPTQPCYIGCIDGVARVTVARDETSKWAFSGGTGSGNYYRWNNPSEPPMRLFDVSATTSYGLYPEVTRVTDLATMQATENSWFYDTSGTPALYVHMTGGAAPTGKIRVLWSLGNINLDATGATGPSAWDATGHHIMLENIAFEGGRQGMLIKGSYPRNTIAINCSWRYTGGNGFDFDGLSVDQVAGLHAFIQCDADANAKDGFNFHNNSATVGPTANVHALTIGCRGRGNGWGNSTSDNGWTSHEDVVGIDIGGYYAGNRGGNVYNIQQTHTLCLGTRAEDSTEATIAPAFKIDNTTVNGQKGRMWLADCVASGGTQALRSQGGGELYERNVTLVAGSRSFDGTSGGFIAPW